MQVVMPWTRRQPEVMRALRTACSNPLAVYVGGSDTDYWRLLAGLWRAAEPFCVVEHDVLVLPDTIDNLTSCEQPWCAHRVPYGEGTVVGLSCVRFSALILRQCPDAMAWVGKVASPDHCAGHWCTLDWHLQHKILPAMGWAVHVHEPTLRHVRPVGGFVKPSHDCKGPGRLPPRGKRTPCRKG